jgi:hypothetical protein
MVVTDRRGRFDCDEARREVDARTVPAGLVAGRLRLEPGESLALRVLQPVRITLRMTSSDSTRVTAPMLSRAVVTALDSVGGKWLARSLGEGEFTVDALPVGTYTITVDGADLDEPVVAIGGPARVRVGADRPDEAIAVELRARPMRLRSFGEAIVKPAAPDASKTTVPSRERASTRAGEPAPERPTLSPRPNQ